MDANSLYTASLEYINNFCGIWGHLQIYTQPLEHNIAAMNRSCWNLSETYSCYTVIAKSLRIFTYSLLCDIQSCTRDKWSLWKRKTQEIRFSERLPNRLFEKSIRTSLSAFLLGSDPEPWTWNTTLRLRELIIPLLLFLLFFNRLKIGMKIRTWGNNFGVH